MGTGTQDMGKGIKLSVATPTEVGEEEEESTEYGVVTNGGENIEVLWVGGNCTCSHR